MKKIVVLLFLVTSFSSFSQKKKDILLTINDTPVTSEEFKRVFKKNLDLVQEEDQKTVDGYLSLFIEYQIKALEAERLGYGEKEAFLKEFSSYEGQISRNYLFEDRAIEEVAREAFERNKYEIDASHLLIRCGYEALPSDTLIAYNKIKNLHERALNGEDFETLIIENSEEPNVKSYKGRLGYFTAFSLVYPFENEAYNTPVGSISNIVRTSFGYHIIKVHDKREKPQQIVVSHIMAATKSKDTTTTPKERIFQIYNLLKAGNTFENLAKQYSDDKNSGKKGGKLKPFVRGDLRSRYFEEAAYSIKEIGDITEPVQSDMGWHIIRLDSIITHQSFEDSREIYENKVKEGNRAKVVNNNIIASIKDKFGFANGPAKFQDVYSKVGEEVLKREYVYAPLLDNENKTLFTIGNDAVTFNDFLEFIEQKQKIGKLPSPKEVLIQNFYEEFEAEEIKKYFRKDLYDENQEYKSLITEYRNGLMIFDFMYENVWNAAKEDTLGQKEYYEQNKQKYFWKERINASIYSSPDKNEILNIERLLGEGKTNEEIKALQTDNSKTKFIIDNGVFENESDKLPGNFDMKKGVSNIYEQNDTYVIVNVSEVLPPSQKTFIEVQGRLITEYQSVVEKRLLNNIKKNYEVIINEKTLKRIKKELGS